MYDECMTNVCIVRYLHPGTTMFGGLSPASRVRYDKVMIAHLAGTITSIGRDSIILTVGGVGYRIFLAPDTVRTVRNTKENQSVALFTHLAVRENALDLFGFLTYDELEFFEMLIAISGIGPKSALGILSMADVFTLRSAISAGDSTYLTKVSGIGKKSAQKIILELQEKMETSEGVGHGGRSGDADTLEALTSLGYSTNEARNAIKQVPSEVVEASERLKEALKLLGK
jgi:holliday junction DNA helicase RuvA